MASKKKTATQQAEVSDLPNPLEPQVGIPEWVILPSDLVIPANKQVMFMRFRSNWTDNPKKGRTILGPDGQPEMRLDKTGPQLWRQVIAWPLNVADKRIAVKRSLGDEDRAMDELSLQMIRAIDGEIVNWGVAGIQEQFWNECGEKVRRLLRATYHRTHNLTAEESVDFFTNCVAVRSASG